MLDFVALLQACPWLLLTSSLSSFIAFPSSSTWHPRTDVHVVDFEVLDLLFDSEFFVLVRLEDHHAIAVLPLA